MKSEITIGDKYMPAMEIMDQAVADAYFEKLVEHSMSFGNDRAKAESVERQNLGYFAGYYGSDTRERVERLFSCEHPVFGKAREHTPTFGEALEAGRRLAGEVPSVEPTPTKSDSVSG